MRTPFSFTIATAGLLLLSACGGGGGSSSTAPPPPAPIVISPSPLPGGIAGTAYSTTLTASGGAAPYSWNVADPQDLPAGFTLNSAGVLSGMEPANGSGFSQTFQVVATDAGGRLGTANVTLNIMGISATLNPMPQVGVQGYNPITVRGAVEPVHWSTSGTLPPGLSLQPYIGDSEYALQGVPTAYGHYVFTVQVTDGGTPARTMNQSVAVDVQSAPLKLSTQIPPPAVVGKSYSYAFQVQGGIPPYHWGLNAGAIPAGFQLDQNTGVLQGSAAAPLYGSFGVHVTDSSTPTSQAANGSFWLLATANPLPARNDTLATATPIVPGSYDASISPTIVSSGVATPDEDYYVMTSPAGSKFSVRVLTYWALQRGSVNSNLDPVLEIVDANGHRFTSCNDPFLDNVPDGVPVPKNANPNFTDPCMNHIDPTDAIGGTSDLQFLVPGNSGNVNFYIHVFDYRGDARPDMAYILYVGAN